MYGANRSGGMMSPGGGRPYGNRGGAHPGVYHGAPSVDEWGAEVWFTPAQSTLDLCII
jgi:hypothetical protein